MTIFERLTHFVEGVFKTNLDTFLEALQLSPNAQGYVSGSITELFNINSKQSMGLKSSGFGRNGKGENTPITMAIFILDDPPTKFGM